MTVLSDCKCWLSNESNIPTGRRCETAHYLKFLAGATAVGAIAESVQTAPTAEGRNSSARGAMIGATVRVSTVTITPRTAIHGG
jgi:hypothetical protein